MTTKEYRKRQFEKIEGANTEYKTMVKFHNTKGETFWLDIEQFELDRIINLLTKGW